MKKILLTLIAIFSVGIFSAMADNDRVINKSQLPAPAQQFLNEHFAGVDLTYAKEERDIFKHSFEVRLADGTKIEFTSKGEWDEVECRFGEVPAAIVPQAIKEYIDKNYAGAKVICKSEMNLKFRAIFEKSSKKDDTKVLYKDF